MNIVYAVIMYKNVQTGHDFMHYPSIKGAFFTLPAALEYVKKLCKIEDDQYDYLLESKSISEIQQAQFRDPNQKSYLSDGEINCYMIEILSVED